MALISIKKREEDNALYMHALHLVFDQVEKIVDVDENMQVYRVYNMALRTEQYADDTIVKMFAGTNKSDLTQMKQTDITQFNYEGKKYYHSWRPEFELYNWMIKLWQSVPGSKEAYRWRVNNDRSVAEDSIQYAEKFDAIR